MPHCSGKYIIGFIFILIRCCAVFSQGSDIIFHSDSDIRFRIYYNDKISEEKSDTIIQLLNVEEKLVNFTIKFDNKNYRDIRQVLNIKPDNTYHYKIVPKYNPENLIKNIFKKTFTIKQISSFKKSFEGDSVLSSNINESIIITTTYASDQYVTHYYLPGYQGDIGCPWPITIKDFNNKLKNISFDSTDLGKMRTAKELFGNSCLFTDEVNLVSMLIKNEKIRLEFVKFAFKCTFDTGNYSMLQDVFQSQIIKNEFNNFLKNRTFK
jgi:hypothetical protein